MADVRAYKEELLKLNQLKDRYAVALLTTVKRNDEFGKELSANQRRVEESVLAVSRKLQAFRNGLSSIQQRLHDFTHATSNVESIQGILENFESKISAYKRSMREEFTALVEEENVYTRDCESMSRKIEEWIDYEPKGSTMADGGGSPMRRKKAERQQAGIKERYEKDMARQAKMGALDRELVLIGGRTGGWETSEHDIFLKVWTQTVTVRPVSKAQRSVLVRRCTPMLPNRTADEVDEHCLYYSNYLDLTDEKKRVLNEWKEERQANKNKEVDAGKAALAQGVDVLETVLPGSPRRSGKVDLEKRENTKQKIAKWREDRAAKEREAKAKKEQDVALKKKAEIDDRVFQRNSNKLRIQKWRNEEKEKQDRLSAARELANRPKTVDPAEVSRRRERDEEMLKRQKEKRDEAEKKRTARERRLRELEAQHEFKADVPITRDTERLLAPTSTYESYRVTPQQRAEAEKRRKETSAHNSTMAGTGRDLAMGGKARAAWMGGVF